MQGLGYRALLGSLYLRKAEGLGQDGPCCSFFIKMHSSEQDSSQLNTGTSTWLCGSEAGERSGLSAVTVTA